MSLPGLMDESNPRALMKIAPQGLAEKMEQIPKILLETSERDLYKMVPVDPSLNRLRLAFWKEYDTAQAEMRNMSWLNISRLVHRPSAMLVEYFNNPKTLAWILCPPAAYDVFLEEALSHGMNRIREILDLPLMTAEGRVDSKVGELILKAAAFLDLRTHGGFLQKSVSASVNAGGMGVRELKGFAKDLSINEIDEKIKKLEEVIDV